MKAFLARHWRLIAIPVVIVLIVIAVILALESKDPQAGFQYPV